MNGSEPAFPETHISHWKANDPEMGPAEHILPRWHGGLTKREYFAAMAMQGLLTKGQEIRSYAFDAVKMADALIAELSKTA